MWVSGDPEVSLLIYKQGGWVCNPSHRLTLNVHGIQFVVCLFSRFHSDFPGSVTPGLFPPLLHTQTVKGVSNGKTVYF